MRYNNTKKRWEIDAYQVRGIVYIDSNYIEFGYFDQSPLNVPIGYQGELFYLDRKEHCSLPLYWSNSNCRYMLNKNNSDNIIGRSKETFYYPIQRCYNFSKLDLEPNKIKFPIEKEFIALKKFTFGLEYETSAGNIPWLDCLNFNLVPLYDGSITGHEYVTFPLKYLELPIVRKHLELLKQFTKHDYNCSLHVHFGGFPIERNKIENLCKFWYVFQRNLQGYIPAWSYYVERYKSNGKAYNKVFPRLSNILGFYNEYTGNMYENDNSFYLPNQYDANEMRKWEVHGRYFNMNIMHLISGNEHKTVEFRFLRPTTNYNEIKWYLLILGAFLNYVINSNDTKYNQITVEKVIRFTFSEDIATKLIIEGQKLYHLHKIQMANSDCPGINERLKEVYLCNLRKFNI